MKRIRPKCIHGVAHKGYLCRKCPGKGICEHDRVRTQCMPCGGSSMCGCGMQKAKCSIHGGSALCPCGLQRAHCITCKGTAICPCGKKKAQCAIHGGKSLCVKGKRFTSCFKHGGDGIFRVPRNKISEWKTRINTLHCKIDWWISVEKPEKTITTDGLYLNDYDEEDSLEELFKNCSLEIEEDEVVESKVYLEDEDIPTQSFPELEDDEYDPTFEDRYY